MSGQRRRGLPLPWRVAGNAFLLVLLLTVLMGALYFPRWKLDRELRAAMAADGARGSGLTLWQGTVNYYGDKDRIVLRRNGERLYLGQLSSHEGRSWLSVSGGQLPEEPGVTLVWMGNGDFLWRPHGGFAGQLMGVSLPEETAGGKLSVTLGPEVIRETEGVWEQKALFFRPPKEWVEYEWGLKKDGIGPYQTGTLQGRPYTLTLWDETGDIISETAGNLSCIWE